MNLWTWHTPGFSLLSGRVDHSRSEYVRTVSEAYRELHNKLGTNQVIWCYTLHGQYVATGSNTRVEWVLDVPENAILGFVDDIVWNCILGIRCSLPTRLRNRWSDEALAKHPYSPKDREQYVEEQLKAFWDQVPPTGSWWDSLFLPQSAAENVSALISHPVRRQWVIACP